jgi:hypothetical protein
MAGFRNPRTRTGDPLRSLHDLTAPGRRIPGVDPAIRTGHDHHEIGLTTMNRPVRELVWRHSVRCSSNACVEMAKRRSRVFVRDSKETDGAHLCFGSARWDAFIAGVKAGEFDNSPN